MAKPLIEFDLTEVEHLAGIGLTNAEIADCLGVSEQTIYNRKRDSVVFVGALKRGKAKAKRAVGNVVFQKALDGDMTAAIWFEKTRVGYSDKMQQDITHKGQFIVDIGGDGSDSTP